MWERQVEGAAPLHEDGMGVHLSVLSFAATVCHTCSQVK